jgi:hypothetical protein
VSANYEIKILIYLRMNSSKTERLRVLNDHSNDTKGDRLNNKRINKWAVKE